MKVLIGIPVHVSKDYAMERWFENVSRLEYPTSLLLVDNSPGVEYVNKLKEYCRKFGIKKYKIKHLGILQGPRVNKTLDEQIHERIVRSEEIIRKEFLTDDYDVWFFWESDILIPTNALRKLIDLMNTYSFWVVTHNCWINDKPGILNFHFGITLFHRDYLEKYSFIPDFRAEGAPPSWYEAENWCRARLQKDGCPYVEVAGLIEPIYHLAK